MHSLATGPGQGCEPPLCIRKGWSSSYKDKSSSLCLGPEVDAGLDSAIALVGRASQTGHLTVLIAKGSFQYTDALMVPEMVQKFLGSL